MAVNNLGAVGIYDGGCPRVYQGYARQAITGGQFVFCSGAAGGLSSGTSSFVAADVEVCTAASGAQFNGIALQDTASGALCPFASRGVYIVMSDGTTTAGYKVITAGDSSVRNYAGTGSTFDITIGRALTTAGSEAFCLVDIQG